MAVRGRSRPALAGATPIPPTAPPPQASHTCKDRRGAGEKGAILGNCKTLTIGQSQKSLKDDQEDDIIPF